MATAVTASLHVLSPGMLTTVQDLGRPGYGELGVSASGAADALSLRIGNRLVGNPDGAAALEMTLVGGAFRLEAGAGVVAITGSGFDPRLDDAPAPMWAPIRVHPGQVLRLGATREGARSYLCAAGGIAVPPTLGSASTHLLTGIGGLGGRALRAGDVLAIGAAFPSPPLAPRLDPARFPGLLRRDRLRVTPGPQVDWFTPAALESFHRSTYQVTESSDRMGIRLDGPILERARPEELVTEGVALGAVQVPSDGKPIILFVEHQTTGGYPKIANVISADCHALGQLRPRERLRFEPVSFDAALRLLQEQEEALDAVLG